jgi:uncharacterized membrane protein
MADTAKSSTNLDENIAGALAYIPIVGLIFLLIEKESEFVRFHSVQSLLLAVIFFVLGFIPLVNLISLCLGLVAFIIGVVQAYQGQMFKFPVIGNIAEKQAKNLPK